MKRFACVLAAIWFAGGQAAIADQFQKVQCGADIPKALIGQRSANERIVVLESRKRKLGLKHLGADEISSQLSSINYLICGSEFVLLEDRKGLVRDAIAFPAHSRKSPAFSGACQANGRDLPGYYIGVLNGEVAGDMLPVLSAWKIDEKNAKLVKAPGGHALFAKTDLHRRRRPLRPALAAARRARSKFRFLRLVRSTTMVLAKRLAPTRAAGRHRKSSRSMPRLPGLISGILVMTTSLAGAGALRDEIAPTGKLRVAIAISPAGGAFWSRKTDSGYAGGAHRAPQSLEAL